MSQPSEAPLSAQQMKFWLDKAVAWGQADRPDTRRDTCLHLSRLRDFLQLLLTRISNTCSTTEIMSRMPFVGQFLGRLCWNPCVTANATSRDLLFQCLWGMHSESPSNALERKANQWIQKVVCQLTTEEDEATEAAVKHFSVSPEEYNLKVLTRQVALMKQKIEKGCSSRGNANQRCSCDSVYATSVTCIPLVTCPEVAPVINALLQRPASCVRAALSEDFLDAVSSAYTSQCLSLEDETVISLWYHNLSSLEEAVLSLLQGVCTNTRSTPARLKEQVEQSLLPKACAQHCSIFLVVNDIFRSVLKHAEGNQSLKYLVQTFTCRFLRELALLKCQTSASLKASFPQSPPSLLVPLSTLPTEMPQEAWRQHLIWLSGSLKRLTEEEEEGEEDSSVGSRGQHNVFEAWFLLVQCSHWVQVALQLLVTSQPLDCGPFLWLLTFYHHPTNRGHHRAQQLVHAREAWDHLCSLSSASALALPLPDQCLQALLSLLSPPAQQPSLSPLLILGLTVNFAVFFQHLPNGSTEILQAVVDGSSLVDEASDVLSSLELTLNAGSCLPSDTNRVHLRIRALQNTLAHMHAASSLSTEHQAHILENRWEHMEHIPSHTHT